MRPFSGRSLVSKSRRLASNLNFRDIRLAFVFVQHGRNEDPSGVRPFPFSFTEKQKGVNGLWLVSVGLDLDSSGREPPFPPSFSGVELRDFGISRID